MKTFLQILNKILLGEEFPLFVLGKAFDFLFGPQPVSDVRFRLQEFRRVVTNCYDVSVHTVFHNCNVRGNV